MRSYSVNTSQPTGARRIVIVVGTVVGDGEGRRARSARGSTKALRSAVPAKRRCWNGGRWMDGGNMTERRRAADEAGASYRWRADVRSTVHGEVPKDERQRGDQEGAGGG